MAYHEGGIETFLARTKRCPVCDDEYPAVPEDTEETCCHGEPYAIDDREVWWWWSCQPGCLPDSDPFGPFDTEEEALADARYDDEVYGNDLSRK